MLLNSNGMDVAITETKLQYKVTGGVLDFYFLMGPTPLKVIDQLTSIIGRPYMPPYWSLGLMQSKWGPAAHHTLQCQPSRGCPHLLVGKLCQTTIASADRPEKDLYGSI